MAALRYSAVLHPNLSVRTLDLMFYDCIRLMTTGTPTNENMELLFEAGIVKNLEKPLQHFDSSGLLSVEHTNNIIGLQQEYLSHYDSLQAYDPLFPTKQSWMRARGARASMTNCFEQLKTPLTQAYANQLNSSNYERAIAIIPTINNCDSYYSKLVDGITFQWLDIPIPKLPIKELISFKFDNQDKLRKLRAAINKLQSEYDDFEDVVEEIDRNLVAYTNTVKKLNRIYELEKIEVGISTIGKFVSFIKNWDPAIFNTSIQLEKAKIRNELELDNCHGSDFSYLYEISNYKANASSS